MDRLEMLMINVVERLIALLSKELGQHLPKSMPEERIGKEGGRV